MIIILQSVIAGLATLIGAVIILLFKRPGDNVLALLLGVTSGIMGGVVIFDLIPSGIKTGNVLTTTGGVLMGLLLLYLLEGFLSGAAPLKRGTQKKRLISMGYLIALGIAMHDLPEGISIAAGYAAADELGLVITLAITLHNIPEGMATAAPLNIAGVKRRNIFLLALAVSFVTPVGTLLGLVMLNLTAMLISPLLGLAAGAMAYIVVKEIIPEALLRNGLRAAVGTAAGLAFLYVISRL